MSIKAIETQYKGYRFRSRLEARWAVFFDALGAPWKYEHEGFDLGGAGWYLPDFYMPDWDCWIEVKPTMPTREELFKFFSMARRLNSGKSEPKEHTMLCGTPGPPQVAVRTADGDWGFGDSYAAITITGGVLRQEGQPSTPSMFFGAFALVEGYSTLDVSPMYFQRPLDKSEIPCTLTPVNALAVEQRGKVRSAANRPYHSPMSVGAPRLFWSLSPSLGWSRRWYTGKGVSFDAPLLTDAYQAARSARFEHGETPK